MRGRVHITIAELKLFEIYLPDDLVRQRYYTKLAALAEYFELLEERNAELAFSRAAVRFPIPGRNKKNLKQR